VGLRTEQFRMGTSLLMKSGSRFLTAAQPRSYPGALTPDSCLCVIEQVRESFRPHLRSNALSRS
jgi:hypothetical protein